MDGRILINTRLRPNPVDARFNGGTLRRIAKHGGQRLYRYRAPFGSTAP